MALRPATVARGFMFALVLVAFIQYGLEIQLFGSKLTEHLGYSIVTQEEDNTASPPVSKPPVSKPPSDHKPPSEPNPATINLRASLKSQSVIALHEIISSFYHVDNTARSVVVTFAFGLADTYISTPNDAHCCILEKQTLERIHAQAGSNATVPLTECIKHVKLKTFSRSTAEGECTFPFVRERTKAEELAYFEDETSWAVVVMDTFEYIKDVRLNATIPLVRSPDRPWTTVPIHKLTFLTELRNVEQSVEELVVYQFLIGFDHGYVYDDHSTDRTKEILQTYADEGLLTLGDVETSARQRQFATITRHRMTHLHETEYIVHLDDDIFFVFPKGKQASPMFAEAAIAQLNRKPDIGSLELMSYWFGPSMHMIPQKLVTQSFLWKDPWIGRIRDWRESKQNNRLSVTRALAIDRTHLTHDYALDSSYKTITVNANEMYFNHYKFRSKAEYISRMDSISAHSSWSWTALGLNNNKTVVGEDIWNFGHKKLDVVIDETMLVFGPSLGWLIHAGPKHLKEYVKEERVLLQQHLDRMRPLVHFVLPTFTPNVDGVAVDTHANYETVAAACALESTLVAFKGSNSNSQDIWIWKTPSVTSEQVNSDVDVIMNQIIAAATTGSGRKEDMPSVKQMLAFELFRNTPFEHRAAELQKIDKKHELARVVQLAVAHKYGGLVLDSTVAMHGHIETSAGDDTSAPTDHGQLNVTDFLSRYQDGYGYVDHGDDVSSMASVNGFVLSVQQRRHVAVWAELERLAGVSTSTFRAVRDNSQDAFEQWPKNAFAQVFVKRSGMKSGASNACDQLARDGWDRLCPNIIAWANCKIE